MLGRICSTKVIQYIRISSFNHTNILTKMRMKSAAFIPCMEAFYFIMLSKYIKSIPNKYFETSLE